MELWTTTRLAAQLEKLMIDEQGVYNVFAFAPTPNNVKVIARRFHTQRTVEAAFKIGLRETEYLQLGAFTQIIFRLHSGVPTYIQEES